jgi:polyvinyl alcohol dehydrogenase (cytochrome)
MATHPRCPLAPDLLEPRDCPSTGWTTYGHDALGSRNNTAEHVLGPASVGRLGLAWTYPGSTDGTPTVTGGSVYVTLGSAVAAVNEVNGIERWKTPNAGFVSDSVLVVKNSVIFGDWNGDVTALDAKTGVQKWKVHPNTLGGPLVAIYGSAVPVGPNVAIGIASNEEQSGVTTFSARGSVALLDPTDGHVIWQTYTIPQAAYDAGWRGASVWSTPTYDRATNTLYITTGNYFQAGTGSDPGVEDAVMALDARTGAIKWTDQLVKGDIWNGNIVPGPDNPDADIGDSPKIVRLPGGHKAIGVGSKDGFYFVMDAATGAPVNGPDGLSLEVGGVLGGLFATGAVDQKDGIEFSNGVNWPTLLQPGDTGPVGGDLYAVSLDGKSMLWDFKTPAPNASGVAIANGVVYFQSIDGNLYALDAKAPDANHALLTTIHVGGSFSGPAVADGRLFVGGGSGIMAFGLPRAVVARARGAVAGVGGALATSAVTLAVGDLPATQAMMAAGREAAALGMAVSDLAAVFGIKAPSMMGLTIDLKVYARAVNAGDATGSQAALAKVKADLDTLFTALATPAVDTTALATDEAALFGTLDTLLTDQMAHDLTNASTDAAAEFAGFLTVFNDLVAGRYGLKF